MIEEPFFVTSDMTKAFYDLRRSNPERRCMECRQPTYRKTVYCTKCLINLYSKGLENEKIIFKEVGIRTIPYQQHLHRKFFGCNANVEYRGIKEHRVPNNIKEKTILLAQKKVHLLMTSPTHRYRKKLRTKPSMILDMYEDVKHIRNIDRRLVYNMLLYYIDYYILESKVYLSYAHFQASVTSHFFQYFERNYIRTNENTKKIKGIRRERLTGCNFTLYPYIFEQMDKHIKQLLLEI